MYRKVVHWWYKNWLDQRQDLQIRDPEDRFPTVLPLNQAIQNDFGMQYDIYNHPDAEIPDHMYDSIVACGITSYAVISEAVVARGSDTHVTGYNLYIGFRTPKEAMMFKLIHTDELAE